jgi:pyridoxal phosphate enzyme (YggS family)
MSTIDDRLQTIRSSIPEGVDLVAAAKSRTSDEVLSALNAGVRIVGHNYVQEAQSMIEAVGRNAATWTMIGHLQRNKAKIAARVFDSIQTVDSLRLAEAIDRECAKLGRVMPVLVEINAAREPQKSGVSPEDAVNLIKDIAQLGSVRIDGLMTMGPWVDDPEALRPIFRRVKKLFDEISRERIPTVSMKTLSMGMSDSYRVAVEEGATMIRIGTALFGPRA